jgi:acyl-CoA synthetase (AMP-forming)/AMP-acid ligase II
LPGYELRVVDPVTLEPLPAGQIGELQGRGPMVMQGYYKKPDETAETILDGGWLRSGDLGYFTETGHLVIAGGRLRDMIIRGGENIYPAEIENLMQAHPAVAGVAVFGIADDYYGEIVAAAVKLSVPVAAAALQAHCAARIAKFKVPAVIYAVESFPLTPSGKIRKVDLRQWAAERRMERLA